jgi:hypothetical protein
MSKLRSSKLKFVTASIFSLLAVFGIQQVVADTPSIKTCVSKSTGLIRVSSKCLKTETLLEISPGGITGAQGTTQVQGSPGIAGYYKVYDSANSLVGNLIGSDLKEDTLDVITPEGYFVTFRRQLGLAIAPQASATYLDTRCAGTLFLQKSELYTEKVGGGMTNTPIYSKDNPILISPYYEDFNYVSDKFYIPTRNEVSTYTTYQMTYLDNVLTCAKYLNTDEEEDSNYVNRTFVALSEIPAPYKTRFKGILTIRKS